MLDENDIEDLSFQKNKEDKERLVW